MGQPAQELMTVDAEVRVPLATARLVRFNVTGPADNVLSETGTHWLDLCLTPRPRNARACYRERWGPDRFRPIGKLFFVPSGERMQARSDGGLPQTSILCHLDPAQTAQWLDEELQWTDRRLEASLDIHDANIRGLLLRLGEEMRHPGFAGETLIELIAAQLAIELRRYCSGVGERRPASGGLAGWRLRLIDERLAEVREAPTLGELAELCRLSVRQLTRGFRASRGQSIGEHVANCRLDHARRLLGTEQSVKAIAYTLGFASPSSFCFAFRRATGQTPQQYRGCALHGMH